jgi:hypothetical protein
MIPFAPEFAFPLIAILEQNARAGHVMYFDDKDRTDSASATRQRGSYHNW